VVFKAAHRQRDAGVAAAAVDATGQCSHETPVAPIIAMAGLIAAGRGIGDRSRAVALR
jgi:hypothetical protein